MTVAIVIAAVEEVVILVQVVQEEGRLEEVVFETWVVAAVGLEAEARAERGCLVVPGR